MLTLLPPRINVRIPVNVADGKLCERIWFPPYQVSFVLLLNNRIGEGCHRFFFRALNFDFSVVKRERNAVKENTDTAVEVCSCSQNEYHVISIVLPSRSPDT